MVWHGGEGSSTRSLRQVTPDLCGSAQIALAFPVSVLGLQGKGAHWEDLALFPGRIYLSGATDCQPRTSRPIRGDPHLATFSRYDGGVLGLPETCDIPTSIGFFP